MSGARTSWISPALARARARTIRNLRYELDLKIDRLGRVLTGRQAIELELTGSAARADLVLDWRPERESRAPELVRESLRLNEAPLPRASIRLDGGHLAIAARHLRPGRNRIELAWTAPIRAAGSALTRFRDADDGNPYVYTLFVPADASTVFPCFDQPDLKARFALSLTIPAAWRAVANAPLVQVEPCGHLRRFRFAPTEPISTYVFAFAAGPFVALGSHAGTGSLWVRRSQVRRARPHCAEVLALNARALSFFARYFGHRFPFAKYDLVAIPDFPYRGMEHAGATFVAEEDMFPAAPCTTAARWGRAQLLFHECAHQWVGNLVTMRAFDDLWLKEGFANFMAYGLARRVLPSALADVDFHRLKVQAYQTDESAGATALHHPLPDMAAAKSAYGSIVYAKAPALLRQLEFMLGDETFRNGVRRWIRRHAHGAADWRDLIAALQAESGRSLARWATAWILRPGVPKLQASIRAGGGAIVVSQVPAGRVRKRSWPLTLRADIVGIDRRVDSCVVTLERSSTRLVPRIALDNIRRLALNAGDRAYAIAACEPSQVEIAGEAILRSRSALARIQLWESVWQSVRDGTVDPARFVGLAVVYLGAERNEMIVSAVLERVRGAMDRFLDTQRRAAVASDVDGFLLEQAGRTAPAQRRAWIDGLITIVSTAEGLDALAALALGGRNALAIVPTALRVRAALMSVIRGAWSASRALRAISSIADTGATVRLQLAAARAEADAKRRVSERLLDDPSLADESILACLDFLNHPVHAPLTQPLLAPALRALPMLERSRKIFFVNRWIGAFVGGQHSPSARHTLRRVLAREHVDEALRRKLLEAEHELGVVVRSRRRWSNG